MDAAVVSELGDEVARGAGADVELFTYGLRRNGAQMGLPVACVFEAGTVDEVRVGIASISSARAARRGWPWALCRDKRCLRVVPGARHRRGACELRRTG